MLSLHKLIRYLCVAAGAVGTLLCIWALLDPSILPQVVDNSLTAPPSPRWRAAFGLLVSLALLGYGTGVLRHRELP